MTSRKLPQTAAAAKAPAKDTSPDLKSQLDNLRQRGESATRPDEVQALLEEARTLLKATFQTNLEDEARRLFRELRVRSDSALVSVQPQATVSVSSGDQLSQRLQRERTRLKSGGLNDMELAVEALYSLLRELGDNASQAPLRAEVLEAIELAASDSEALRRKVRELLESPDGPPLPETQALLDRLAALPTDSQSARPRTSQAPATPPLEAGLAERLSAARRLFYAGDYYEAVDLLTDILRSAPENQEARDRLAQVEDNLRRGVVPDSRVPFEARAAYGRAQSLERAGRFEEAREAYTVSLTEARKGGELLQNWQPAVEALLRVDNSIIARSIRNEADACLQTDKWREALEKYGTVLKLLPDDEQARERLQLLRVLLEQSESVRTQYSTNAVNLVEMSQKVVELRRTIYQLRPQMPDSQRLSEMEAALNTGAQNLKDRLLGRSEQLTAQARYLPNVSASRRLMAEASRLVEQARALAPGDGTVFDLAEGLKTDLARLEQAEGELAEARRLLNLDTSAGRMQARDLLRRLQDFNQEPLYLQLLSALQSQYLEEARSALRRKQFDLAHDLLQEATDEAFGILGSSEEAWRLQQELDTARRGPWLRRLAISLGVVGIVVIVAFAGFGRVMSVYGISWLPAPTASPDPSPTLTLTVTASATATPLPTATSRPSLTPVPSLTPTPLDTATPTPRVGAVNKNSAARLRPSGGAPWAFSLRAADPVQVLEEAIDDQGYVWYKVLYVRDDLVLTGWAQAADINVMSTPVPD